MKTIIFKNNKGGVGKTTMSVNLAALLSIKHKVLIIDSDERSNTTRMYQKQGLSGTLGEVLLDKKPIQECIVATRYPNIDLLGTTNELAMDIKELEQKQFLVDYENLKHKLELVEQHYDYCIIDCSQKIDLLALNTLFAADCVVIPTRAEENSLVGVLEMVQVVKQVNQKRTKKLIAKILVSDKERNNACDVMIERMRFVLDNDLIFDSIIKHQSAVVSTSVKEDVLTPFVFIDKYKNSGIVHDMYAFKDELLQVMKGDEENV